MWHYFAGSSHGAPQEEKRAVSKEKSGWDQSSPLTPLAGKCALIFVIFLIVVIFFFDIVLYLPDRLVHVCILCFFPPLQQWAVVSCEVAVKPCLRWCFWISDFAIFSSFGDKKGKMLMDQPWCIPGASGIVLVMIASIQGRATTMRAPQQRWQYV